MNRRALLLSLLPLLAGCKMENKQEQTKDDKNPTGPSDVPVVPTPDTIEFRVTGDLTSVVVRQSDSINGMTQILTGLPYFSSFKSLRDNLFLSLEASAPGYFGFVSVQIFINGTLFREASMNGFDPKIAVSGTFRRTVPQAR